MSSERKLPEVKFVRTVCPTCAGIDNYVSTTQQRGRMIVRYHCCSCTPGGYAFRSIEVVDVARRQSKVPRH